MTRFPLTRRFLFACALLAAGGAGRLTAAAPPAGLEMLPRDSVAFVSVRVAELWRCEALRDLWQLHRHDPQTFPNLEEMTREFLSIGPADVERATWIFRPHDDGALLVTAARPLDRSRVLKAQAKGAKAQKIEGKQCYVNEETGTAFAFLDDRNLLICSQMEGPFRPAGRSRYVTSSYYRATDPTARLREWLRCAGPKSAEKPADDGLALADRPHHVVIGWQMSALAGCLDNHEVPCLPALCRARSAVLTLNLEGQPRVEFQLNFATASQAKDGRKAIRTACDLVRGQLLMFAVLAESRELSPIAPCKDTLRLVRQIEKTLQAVPIETDGKTVRGSFQVKADMDTVGAGLLGLARAISGESAGGRWQALPVPPVHGGFFTPMMPPPACVPAASCCPVPGPDPVLAGVAGSGLPPGLVLPSPHYLQHPPQYMPPAARCCPQVQQAVIPAAVMTSTGTVEVLPPPSLLFAPTIYTTPVPPPVAPPPPPVVQVPTPPPTVSRTVTITVVNASKSTVALFRKGDDGKLELCKKVGAGETCAQKVHAGCVWTAVFYDRDVGDTYVTPGADATWVVR